MIGTQILPTVLSCVMNRPYAFSTSSFKRLHLWEFLHVKPAQRWTSVFSGVCPSKQEDVCVAEPVLCVCVEQVLEEEEYDAWLKRQLLAESSIENREGHQRMDSLFPSDMWGAYVLGNTHTHIHTCTHNLALSKTVGCNRAKTITKLYLPDLIPSYGPKVITFKLQNWGTLTNGCGNLGPPGARQLVFKWKWRYFAIVHCNIVVLWCKAFFCVPDKSKGHWQCLPGPLWQTTAQSEDNSSLILMLSEESVTPSPQKDRRAAATAAAWPHKSTQTLQWCLQRDDINRKSRVSHTHKHTEEHAFLSPLREHPRGKNKQNIKNLHKSQF